MHPFTHSVLANRVVFGRGSIQHAAAELERLTVTSAMVISTPHQRADALALVGRLGQLGAGTFTEAAMHTPGAVTERAMRAMREMGADGLVALGGGSTIGLAKALSARTSVPHLAIPTTYAGSEVTPILGETKDGVKTTRRDPSILPETVIYDPDLVDSLPLSLTVTSGLNAMAHAVEAIYARDGSPLYSLTAVEALTALHEALPVIANDPGDREGRDRALYGAWLCGTVLGAVGMSIHHKLCHTLGGAMDLPHAETHAVLLPHTAAFVEAAVPDALEPARLVFGQRVGHELGLFAASLGAPQSLAELGVAEGDLDRLADLATANPYWSPRPIDRDSIRALLQSAWCGVGPV